MNLLTLPWRSLRAQLLMLQLENYELTRALPLMLRGSIRPPTTTRKEIVWTMKLRLVVLVATLVLAGIGVLLANDPRGALTAVLLFSPLATPALVLALGLLAPIDWLAKMLLVARAKRKLATRTDLKIIGIGGSYGKTTLKEAITLTLGQSKNVLATPGNVNTPLGIARLILDDLLPETEVFIVEMGAHYPGDIAALMRLVEPTIVVENGINETHLERFGGWEHAIAAESELLSELAPDGRAIVNADDEVVMRSYKKFLGEQKKLFYSARCHPAASCVACESEVRKESATADVPKDSCAPTENEFDRTTLSRRVSLPEIGEIKLQLLPHYAAGVAAAATLVARELGIDTENIRRALQYLPPIPHRLQAMRNDTADILVIDDSYNGNTAGVREALSLLNEFRERRRVYITPGLVELGEASDEIHREIGGWLAAANLDEIVLIDTSASQSIAAGLAAAEFPIEKVQTFPSAQAAHEYVQKTARRGDVILFQNDWPDNYR